MYNNRDLEKYSVNYSDQPYEEFQVFFRKKKIIEFLNYYNPKSILEVGCGLESILLEYNYFDKITIVEPSIMFFEKLQNDILSNKFNVIIESHCCFFEEFKTDDKYDFIIISSLLHEIPNLKPFIDKLVQIADKDTIIHINVPNSESFHRLLALESGLITSTNELSDFNKSFQQQRVFSINDIVGLCLENNLEILSSGSFAFKPFTHFQMSKIISSNSVDINIIRNLHRLDKYLNGKGSEIFVNVRKK